MWGATDEEAAGALGTGFLRERWVFQDVDFSVLGEQTSNCVALAHKGTPLGPGPASVNLVTGGAAANVVAESCEATIDRRMVPPEQPGAVCGEIEALLRNVERARPGIRLAIADADVSPWFEAQGDEPLTRRFGAIVGEETGGEPGPGGYEQAHSGDEWVAVDELVAAARILIRFLDTSLGKASAGAAQLGRR